MWALAALFGGKLQCYKDHLVNKGLVELASLAWLAYPKGIKKGWMERRYGLLPPDEEMLERH